MSHGAFSELACAAPGCPAVIVLHRDQEQRLRRTGESFYCPAGHSQHFTGKTAEQREIERLQKVERWLEEALHERLDELQHRSSCPWEDCPRASYPYATWRTLLRHLHSYHDGRVPEPHARLEGVADDEAVPA